MVEESIIDRVNAFANIVRQHFVAQKIILFGSQLKGTAPQDCGIDMAVVFNTANVII